MAFPVASRLAPFGTSIFATITRLAHEHRAINLGQGFPDFDGPDSLKQAAIRAIAPCATGHNQYARSAGEPALVHAIASDWQRRTGQAVDPMSQVTVTSGCTEALAAVFLGLIEPGDEVVLIEPFYDAYVAGVGLAGAVPRFVALRRSSDGTFALDLDELASSIGPRSRMIVLNTPHNPTGTVFTAQELRAIADLCLRHDLILLSDEVYEHLVLDDHRQHVSPATLAGMAERTIVCSSLGKTCSVTGWKIGWTIASAPLSSGIRAAHQFLTFATSTPMQHAAAEVLDQGLPHVPALRAQLRSARDRLASTLRDVGMQPMHASAGYFLLADCAPISDLPDTQLCPALIAEAGVAAIPPSVFCHRPELVAGLVRFAFCKKPATIDAACERLRAWAQRRSVQSHGLDVGLRPREGPARSPVAP